MQNYVWRCAGPALIRSPVRCESKPSRVMELSRGVPELRDRRGNPPVGRRDLPAETGRNRFRRYVSACAHRSYLRPRISPLLPACYPSAECPRGPHSSLWRAGSPSPSSPRPARQSGAGGAPGQFQPPRLVQSTGLALAKTDANSDGVTSTLP